MEIDVEETLENMDEYMHKVAKTAHAAFDMINGYCAGKVAEEMTRRDHFAVAALQSLVAVGAHVQAGAVAKTAWVIADAMEAARGNPDKK